MHYVSMSSKTLLPTRSNFLQLTFKSTTSESLILKICTLGVPFRAPGWFMLLRYLPVSTLPVNLLKMRQSYPFKYDIYCMCKMT